MSIALGLIAGVLAFLPFVWALKAQRNVTDTSHLSYSSILVLALVGSIGVLIAATVACIFLNREGLLPFAVSEAAALIVASMAYGIWRVLLRNRGQEGAPKQGAPTEGSLMAGGPKAHNDPEGKGE